MLLSRYTQEQTCLYGTLRDQLGLNRTGGSDIHGEKVKSDITFRCRPMDIHRLLRIKTRPIGLVLL